MPFDYSAAYLETLEGYWTKASFPLISSLLRTSIEHTSGAVVLDLGCGNGAYGALLAGQGRHAFAMDVSESSVRKCTALGTYHSVVQSTADRLPFMDRRFDVVFSTEVLEHIDDLPAAITEVARVLKEKGSFIFTTTLYAGSIWTYWGQSKSGRHSILKRLTECARYLAGFASPTEQERFVRLWCFEPLGGHYHGFHIRQLNDLVTRRGFTVVDTKRFYAVEPIPLLDNGRLQHVWMKKFPLNIVLLPAAVAIRIANVILKLAGAGANNVFMVAQKE